MLDDLYNIVMAAFSLSLFITAKVRRLHTGVLGTLGLVLMGGAALLSIDNSTISSIERTEWCFMIFATGSLCVLTYAWRSVPRKQCAKEQAS